VGDKNLYRFKRLEQSFLKLAQLDPVNNVEEVLLLCNLIIKDSNKLKAKDLVIQAKAKKIFLLRLKAVKLAHKKTKLVLYRGWSSFSTTEKQKEFQSLSFSIVKMLREANVLYKEIMEKIESYSNEIQAMVHITLGTATTMELNFYSIDIGFMTDNKGRKVVISKIYFHNRKAIELYKKLNKQDLVPEGLFNIANGLILEKNINKIIAIAYLLRSYILARKRQNKEILYKVKITFVKILRCKYRSQRINKKIVKAISEKL